MKKVLFLFLAISLNMAVYAQDDSDVTEIKNSESYLPQAGDFALGIDATPFVNLIGNIVRINDFNGPFNDPSSFNFVDGASIYGKYFLTDNSAVRVRFDVHSMSGTDNQYITDDTDTVDFTAKVLDTRKMTGGGVNLGIGYEMRRGTKRLQAFYGAELNFMFGGGLKTEYTYGNSFSNDSTPTYFDWTTMTENTLAIDQKRIVDETVSGGFGIGLRGFVGVEYFLFPKISLGGEFGWGFSFNSIGEGEINTENWSSTDYNLETLNTKVGGSKNFNLGTDNLGGNIFMMIHF